MASSYAGIKQALTASSLAGHEFQLLAEIAALKTTHGNTHEVQELVIRALDRSAEFQTEMPILMALARDHGLFPYVENIAPELLPLADIIALEMNRPEHLEDVVFHRVQTEVYRRLMAGENVILSAPTSFGKTLVLDALLASSNYTNVVIIVPTVALIDEIRRRVSRFAEYKLITHPGQSYGDKNLFVLTQERYLAIQDMPTPDLFFIDEFYKLDDHNSGKTVVNDRSELLNTAMYRLRRTGAQFYLAAPVIQALSELLPAELRASLIVTDYSTVAADVIPVEAETAEDERAEIKRILAEVDGPTLIYCRSPKRVRDVVGWLQQDAPSAGYASGMMETASWLEENISPRWRLPGALRLGIGVHHGRLPRWLPSLAVSGFDDGALRVLVCTNSLIEGVNTRAKNVIVLDHKIGNSRPYNYFTYANIKGRGGRFLKHFIGNIFVFNDPPEETLPSVDIPGISQSDGASDSLLLSIDEADRTASSRERLRYVTEQSILSLEVISKNVGVDPSAQIDLASRLLEAPSSQLTPILWTTSRPSYSDLAPVIELIWSYIAPPGQTNHMARSANQLAFFVSSLSQVNGDPSRFIEKIAKEEDTDDQYDTLVESTFDFLRFWIDHNLPSRLRALDLIAKEVLPRRGIQAGNYEPFAAQCANGFRPPLVLVTEEFGIPAQVTTKLLRHIGTPENLDELLWRLRELDLTKVPQLSPFEIALLDRALGSN